MGYLELWGVVVVLAFYLFGKRMSEMRLEFASQHGCRGRRTENPGQPRWAVGTGSRGLGHVAETSWTFLNKKVTATAELDGANGFTWNNLQDTILCEKAKYRKSMCYHAAICF